MLFRLRPHGLELVRGRFGGRTAYYAKEAGGLVVVACSRLAPLASTHDRQVTLDPERLGELAASQFRTVAGWIDAEATCYREIRRAPPSTVLSFSPEGVVRAPLPSLYSLRGTPQTPERAAELVRSHVVSAVARATVDTRRVAVLLSGGLDSSGVLAAAVLANSHRQCDVLAFNLEFSGPGDDRPHVREIAERLGVPVQRLSPSDAGDHWMGLPFADGAPVTWVQAGWDAMLLRAARESGAEVILSGMGGDDVFYGDLDDLGRRARSGDLGALLCLWRLRSPVLSSRARRMSSLVVRPMIRALAPRFVRRRIAMRRNRRAARYSWAGPRLKVVLARAEDARQRANSKTPRYDMLAQSTYLLEIQEAGSQLGESRRMRIARSSVRCGYRSRSRFAAPRPSIRW